VEFINREKSSENQVKIVDEIQLKVPLIENLMISDGIREDSTLPPIVGLVASFFCQDTEDDACLVVPVKGDIAYNAAVLSSLNSFQKNCTALAEKYLEKDLVKGDKVKVQPTGDVFVYDGYTKYEGKVFFRLKFLNDPSNSSRSFPLGGAIRLEKTNDVKPRGTGSSLGKMIKSPLDKLTGSEVGGNRALLENELIIVTEMKRFKHFLQRYKSRNKALKLNGDNGVVELSDAIELGKITSDGKLIFVNSDVKDGKPLIAVSRSLSDVANYCKINNMPKQKIIIDGAKRTSDHLSDISKILEFSRVVILADHAEIENVSQLKKMNCSILNVNNQLAFSLIENCTTMPNTVKKFYNASRFKLTKYEVVNCELDLIYSKIREFDSVLKSEDDLSPLKKTVKQFYNALMDLAALVDDQGSEHYERIKQNLNIPCTYIIQNRVYLPASFVEISNSILKLFEKIFETGAGKLTLMKGTLLLEAVETSVLAQQQIVVVCRNQNSQKSVENLLLSAGYEKVKVILPDQLSDYTDLDKVILNGMPWANKLNRLLSDYRSSEIDAIVYKFEYYSIKKRLDAKARILKGWSKNTKELAQHTGIPAEFLPLVNTHGEAEASSTFHDLSHFDLDSIMANIKKGTPVDSDDPSREDYKDCRYVGFTESAYAYLTDGFKIPVVTDFLNLSDNAEGRHVGLRYVNELLQGDKVVFRVSSNSDTDLIKDTARLIYGPLDYDNLRTSSSAWKDVLHQQALSTIDLRARLSAHGLDRTLQAVRGWLTNPYVIGVQQESDLRVIMSLSTKNYNDAEIDKIWYAMKKIRSMHTTAGKNLKSLLEQNLDKLASSLKSKDIKRFNLKVEGQSLGQFEIVEVEDISKQTEQRPLSEIDKLLKEY
jgi:hypothetical protein